MPIMLSSGKGRIVPNSKLLSQLPEIGQRMREIRATEPLLAYVVDISLELLQAQFGFLVLIDDDGRLDFRIAHDEDGHYIPDPETQISRTIMYHVIEMKKYVLTAKAVSDSNFENAESVNALSLRSVLCVPLISLGTAIGVIYLENRDVDNLFQDADVEPLLFLAGHAAASIHNAILKEELEQLSRQRIDDLIKLSEDGELPSDVLQIAIEKERSRILGYFIQDVSHQFRTPLAVIKTSVDVLSRKVNPELTGNYIPRIHEQVNTVVKLVDSLSLLAKLDMNIERNFQEDDLALIVHDMWEVLIQQAYRKGVEVTSFAGSQVVEVPLIQDLARKAIGKILENAIMYTESEIGRAHV